MLDTEKYVWIKYLLSNSFLTQFCVNDLNHLNNDFTVYSLNYKYTA